MYITSSLTQLLTRGLTDWLTHLITYVTVSLVEGKRIALPPRPGKLSNPNGEKLQSLTTSANKHYVNYINKS